jgi:SWI/SNF-related matrix-associated actin-dependent regulator of chromatin subfamily A-like protein 1
MNNLLESAIKTLAVSCDYASTKDAAGFNKIDTGLGHKLASIPEEKWTPGQRRAAWKMLAKYHKQLTNAGINYSSIPEPPIPVKSEIIRSIDFDGQNFIFHFPYNAELVEQIKRLPNRKFNKSTYEWVAMDSFRTAETCLELVNTSNFEPTDSALTRIYEQLKSKQENIAMSTQASIDSLVLPTFSAGRILRPFQKVAVAFAIKNKQVLIADEMGLGKTIESIATLETIKAFPALIVCPASLKLVWKEEFNTWTPHNKTLVISGTKQSRLPKRDVVIINYDILHNYMDYLKAIPFKAVVLDESHFVKNSKAKRTKLCKELTKNISYRLALTGTPILNRPAELISQLEILGHLKEFGGFWPFASRYCGAFRTRFGLDISGATNLDELALKLRAICMIRRTKKDVLKELPAKQMARIPIEITNTKEYEAAEENIIKWIEENKNDEAAWAAMRAEQLVRIETLKQIVARGKLQGVVEWINNFLEGSDEKLVVFANHIEIQKELLKAFPEALRILGEDNLENRQLTINAFQNDPGCRLIICSLQAGGFGITLTAASNVAFVELGWTPAIHMQAEDRCHRIGQKDEVTAWYLIADNTIDSDIEALLATKRNIVDATTDNSVKDTGILNDVISKLLNKKKIK